MKHLLITILLFICVWADAQVQKNVVVELFSNTRCSVCGALEPGIFNTLNPVSYTHLDVYKRQ